VKREREGATGPGIFAGKARRGSMFWNAIVQRREEKGRKTRPFSREERSLSPRVLPEKSKQVKKKRRGGGGGRLLPPSPPAMKRVSSVLGGEERKGFSSVVWEGEQVPLVSILEKRNHTPRQGDGLPASWSREERLSF